MRNKKKDGKFFFLGVLIHSEKPTILLLGFLRVSNWQPCRRGFLVASFGFHRKKLIILSISNTRIVVVACENSGFVN